MEYDHTRPNHWSIVMVSHKLYDSNEAIEWIMSHNPTSKFSFKFLSTQNLDCWYFEDERDALLFRLKFVR